MPSHMPRERAVAGPDAPQSEAAPTAQPSIAFDISGLLARLRTFFKLDGGRAPAGPSEASPVSYERELAPAPADATRVAPPTPLLDEASRAPAGPSITDWENSRPTAASTDTVEDGIEGYETALDRDRERLRRLAATDPTSQGAADHRMQTTVSAGHQAFGQLTAGGTTAPTPYMVNYSGGTWDQRKGSRARRLLYGNDADGNRLVDDDTLSWAGIGKASAAQMQTVLTAIVQNRLWEKLPRGEKALFDAAVARILPPEASDDVKAAASALAYAEVAGLGTDCSGYVQHVLVKTGVLPAGLANEIKSMTGATALTSGLGDRVSTTARGAMGPVPLDASGNVSVRPGDTVKIDGGGHIGVVHDAVDTGGEVVIRYSHSTPNQEVMHGNTDIGATPEGVRLDIIAWDKQTRRWKAVRSAFSTNQLNNGVLNGFYRLDRDRVTASAKGWMGVQDPWAVERDTARHGA